MKKRLLWNAGLFTGIGLLGFWFVLWWATPTDLISKQTADQIELGMTVDEAVAIVGVPPRIYMLNGREVAKLKWWYCEAGIFYITLDEKERIDGIRHATESWRQKAHRWFRLGQT